MKKVYLPLLAYLGLAGAIAFSIHKSQEGDRIARAELAAEIYVTQIAACDRGNRLRGALRSVLAASQDITQDATDVSPSRKRISAAFYAEQLPKFKNVDCAKAFPAPRHGH